ncbi:hypothetical protein [Photobacterium leiognathi]|nr:hypothetical protein [Photobacterium leiognathi]
MRDADLKYGDDGGDATWHNNGYLMTASLVPNTLFSSTWLNTSL